MRSRPAATRSRTRVSIDGMKWLQGGSGFGFSPNSGWRNAQHAGISEQFTFATPAIPVINGATPGRLPLLHQHQHGRLLERRLGPPPHLQRGAAPTSTSCPTPRCPSASPTPRTSTASARPPLPAAPTTSPRCSPTTCSETPSARPSSRSTPTWPRSTPAVRSRPPAARWSTTRATPPWRRSTRCSTAAGPSPRPRTSGGVLHDPTAILYVRTADLVARNPADARCLDRRQAHPHQLRLPGHARARRPRWSPSCCAPPPATASRSRSGTSSRPPCRTCRPSSTCPRPSPATAARSRRDARRAATSSTFNNNNVRPSSYVGIRPALVAHNVRQDTGIVVGSNPNANVAAPGASVDLQVVRRRRQPGPGQLHRLQPGGHAGGVRRHEPHALRPGEARPEGAGRRAGRPAAGRRPGPRPTTSSTTRPAARRRTAPRSRPPRPRRTPAAARPASRPPSTAPSATSWR